MPPSSSSSSNLPVWCCRSNFSLTASVEAPSVPMQVLWETATDFPALHTISDRITSYEYLAGGGGGGGGGGSHQQTPEVGFKWREGRAYRRTTYVVDKSITRVETLYNDDTDEPEERSFSVFVSSKQKGGRAYDLVMTATLTVQSVGSNASRIIYTMGYSEINLLDDLMTMVLCLPCAKSFIVQHLEEELEDYVTEAIRRCNSKNQRSL